MLYPEVPITADITRSAVCRSAVPYYGSKDFDQEPPGEKAMVEQFGELGTSLHLSCTTLLQPSHANRQPSCYMLLKCMTGSPRGLHAVCFEDVLTSVC